MSKQSYEEFLEGRESRRLKNEARAFDRFEKQMDRADTMIGQLANGKMYVYPVGGKYKEGSYSELTNYLIRNKWV